MKRCFLPQKINEWLAESNSWFICTGFVCLFPTVWGWKGLQGTPAVCTRWPLLRCRRQGGWQALDFLPSSLGLVFLGLRENPCTENFESKPCLSQAELTPGPRNVCLRGGFRGKDVLKQPDLVDIGQQYPRKVFGVEVWLSFFSNKLSLDSPQTFRLSIPRSGSRNLARWKLSIGCWL